MKHTQSLKHRVGLGAGALVLITGAAMWGLMAYLLHTTLIADRRLQARQQFAYRVDAVGGVLASYERAASEIARVGELLIQMRTSSVEAIQDNAWQAISEKALVSATEEFAEVVASGLWFDPKALGTHEQPLGYQVRLTSSRPEFLTSFFSPFPELAKKIREQPEVLWSAPYQDVVSQLPMLTIGAPIRNSTEAVVGIATVSVDARQLAFALQELDPTGTSQSFLIDPANGTFVSVSGRNDLFMKEVSGVAWGKFALELRDSAEPRSLDLAAGTRWFHRARLKNGLVFGMSVPEQEALGSVTAVSAWLHNEAAMIILVALLLVFPISAFALRPIWYPPELRQVDRRNSEPSFDSRGQLFMDPAQQSRARFIEAVSHEIREPVASILSTAEASDGAPTQAEAAGALMLIQGRALGILSVLDDLLDLAALEDGTLVVRRSAFRLRETLDRVLQTVQTQVERKRIVLHCEIHKEVPDELIGDAARLGQVLVYMLQNSVRFTPDLGGILILVSSITRPSGRIELQFAVSDSGIGIPAGKVQAIFEPYKRGHDASLHIQKTGAGLGLTIARALVERMGGEVRVESREGVGTTFRFMVVVIDQASHDLAAPKVLVVDADGRDEGLPALLVQAGVPFCIASDTAELNGLLAQENLRLVLLDVPIDDRIGVALLSAISAPDGRHRFVPVVGFKDRKHEKTSLLDSVVSGWVDRPVDWGGANEVVSRFAVSVADVAETGSKS